MTVILVWSLVDIEAPRLITSDNRVIDLLNTDPVAWEQHISRKNIQRVIDQIHRWKVAVQAGADAITAYGYAIGGNGYDYPQWLLHEEGAYPVRLYGH